MLLIQTFFLLLLLFIIIDFIVLFFQAPVAPASAKKGVPVLPVNLDELKKSPSEYSYTQRQ